MSLWLKSAAVIISLFVIAPAFAFDDCSAELTRLGTLYQLRTLMAKSYTSSYDVERFIDRRIEELREPLPGGGHRWIRWVRPTGRGSVIRREHNVAALQSDRHRDRVEVTGGHVYAASVVVPRKRSPLRDNKPVWVGTAEVLYEVGGETMVQREHINQWMSPGTSRTITLPGIADRAQASVDAAVAPREVKQALVELHLHQAVAEDDPANPAYCTIRMLQRLRESAQPAEVDAEIAAAEASLFRGVESMPILTIVTDLRRADELMRSDDPDEQEEGSKLLRATLRRLP